MNRHILVVLPHPDDEAFGLAGTLAKHIDHGVPVTYICLTLGEMGRNLGNPPIANRETLPEIRRQELLESCRIIGIQDVRMFGLHDKTIEFEDHDRLAARIREVIDEVKPSTIYTFYPGFSVHPDHDATGAVVIKAVQEMPEEERPAVHCLAFSRGCEEVLGPPQIVHDVSDYMKQKVGAIRAHRSQFLFNMDDEELVKKNFGTERFWIYRFV
ncbi:bacillithiol biosynthesis deacetylase BshB2 [Insulibacter thermoxylanivorax]|uniref:Bacillithiol biosynthesis deacetylase BshB2 n=1 Tax=Insulibacter thermoxylanivorax TaxID=2749268 RepID=A0A916QDX9_9BACL|nr:bacillithiol biosynthesis deacetylase BshB2 [Insulibacter thermoxylanivorax]GFR37633.1 bacillithiol biosynthesis deacetylase BshB2 [Insulibacter thermoxylanivorax]